MDIKTVCYGEVLWDVFPDEAKIGGAPLNVAFRLSATGIKTKIISAVGKDQKGEDILTYLKENKIITEHVKTLPSYPTGEVIVTLSSSGSASYEIAYPSAWDKIEYDPLMSISVEQADAFIFGSLVGRDDTSRSTLYRLLKNAKFKIFDINLRPPHYEKDVLIELMQAADFIKFNDEELFEISKLLGSPYNSLEQNLQFVSLHTKTKSICITKGSHGAVLLKEGQLFYNSGFLVQVKDTVGAGDSFLASLVAKLLQKEDPQAALDYACAVGALVAGCKGANPQLKEEEIQNFMNSAE